MNPPARVLLACGAMATAAYWLDLADLDGLSRWLDEADGAPGTDPARLAQFRALVAAARCFLTASEPFRLPEPTQQWAPALRGEH